MNIDFCGNAMETEIPSTKCKICGICGIYWMNICRNAHGGITAEYGITALNGIYSIKSIFFYAANAWQSGTHGALRVLSVQLHLRRELCQRRWAQFRQFDRHWRWCRRHQGGGSTVPRYGDAGTCGLQTWSLATALHSVQFSSSESIRSVSATLPSSDHLTIVILVIIIYFKYKNVRSAAITKSLLTNSYKSFLIYCQNLLYQKIIVGQNVARGTRSPQSGSHMFQKRGEKQRVQRQ